MKLGGCHGFLGMRTWRQVTQLVEGEGRPNAWCADLALAWYLGLHQKDNASGEVTPPPPPKPRVYLRLYLRAGGSSSWCRYNRTQADPSLIHQIHPRMIIAACAGRGKGASAPAYKARCSGRCQPQRSLEPSSPHPSVSAPPHPTCLSLKPSLLTTATTLHHPRWP